MDIKFYRCSHCGNIITKLTDSGVPVHCCGEPMVRLDSNTDDGAAVEKHVPIVEKDGSSVVVKVGSVDHPMAPEHFIEWIYLVTDNSSYVAHLKAGDYPQAEFRLNDGSEVKAVYAYCNLHGLWQANL